MTSEIGTDRPVTPGHHAAVTRRRAIRPAIAVAVLVLVLGLATTACGGSGSGARGQTSGSEAAATRDPARTRVPTETYVGRVDGTDAYLAVSTSAGTASVYVCDSKQIAEWLAGEVDGAQVSALPRTGADRLSATRNGDAWRGTVVLSGTSHAFTATRAARPAGLWVTTDGDRDTRGTWIVLPDGTQRGIAVKNGIRTIGTVDSPGGQATIGDQNVSAGSAGSTGTPTPDRESCAELRGNYQSIRSLHDKELAKKQPDWDYVHAMEYDLKYIEAQYYQGNKCQAPID